jgi:hypothetical protein
MSTAYNGHPPYLGPMPGACTPYTEERLAAHRTVFPEQRDGCTQLIGSEDVSGLLFGHRLAIVQSAADLPAAFGVGGVSLWHSHFNNNLDLTYAQWRMYHPHRIDPTTGFPEKLLDPVGLGLTMVENDVPLVQNFETAYVGNGGHQVLHVEDTIDGEATYADTRLLRQFASCYLNCIQADIEALAMDMADHYFPHGENCPNGNGCACGGRGGPTPNRRYALDAAAVLGYHRWHHPNGFQPLPAAQLQPIGGRCISMRDCIYHYNRSGGICCENGCNTELNFAELPLHPLMGGPDNPLPTTANTPCLARIDHKIHHYGMDSDPGADNIAGYCCRACM